MGCAGVRSICGCGRDADLLASCHTVSLSRLRSFAIAARLVLRCCSDCPMPCDLPRLLDCLGSSVARFLLKCFNEFDVPVSRSSSSRHLGNAACLPPCVPPSRLASRPVLFWVMSSPSFPIAPSCRSGLAVINRPALLVVGRGAGRDGEPLSSSPVRLAAVACLGGRLGCVRFLVAVCSACLGAAHLCRYCVGGIVYMICLVAII